MRQKSHRNPVRSPQTGPRAGGRFIAISLLGKLQRVLKEDEYGYCGK